MLLHGELTDAIIGSFYTVYDKLGYGYFENVYCAALTIELRRRGLAVGREVNVPVYYGGVKIARYKMDFVVANLVVLEVKSTLTLCDADHRQLINYLRCTDFEVGLLLHFGPEPKVHRKIATEEFKR